MHEKAHLVACIIGAESPRRMTSQTIQVFGLLVRNLRHQENRWMTLIVGCELKISMPRDLHETRKSKSSIKTRVKKHNITMHKDARNQMTRRTRDLFANDYLFLRTPVLSTTIFEAESKTRFVNNMNRTINPSAPQIAPELLFGLQPIFDHGCLLNEINLKKSLI